MNRERVMTVIVSAKRAVRVDLVRRSLFGDRACQNTNANFSLLPICNRQIVRHFNVGV